MSSQHSETTLLRNGNETTVQTKATGEGGDDDDRTELKSFIEAWMTSTWVSSINLLQSTSPLIVIFFRNRMGYKGTKNGGDYTSNDGSMYSHQQSLQDEGDVDAQIRATATQISLSDMKAFRQVPEDLTGLTLEEKKQMLMELEIHLRALSQPQDANDTPALKLTRYIQVQHRQPGNRPWEPVLE